MDLASAAGLFVAGVALGALAMRWHLERRRRRTRGLRFIDLAAQPRRSKH